jgi:NAD+ synthase (glutamine-hydrolysing)
MADQRAANPTPAAAHPSLLPATGAQLGLVRAAVITPELRVADVAFNTARIVDALGAAATEGVALCLFPELCLTSYSCGDLFYQHHLLTGALAALQEVAAACAHLQVAAVVGLPLAVEGRLYNCAAFLAPHEGLVGLVPKSYLPTTGEFYEERWFTAGAGERGRTVRLAWGGEERDVPFGVDLLFAAASMPDCVVGIEVCEDLWAVEPPSGRLALAGATILLNGSASTEVLGKDSYRRDLVRQQSGRCMAAYLYAGSGPGESTTDVVYAGHSMIAENGVILAETERFRFESQMAIIDVDVQRLQAERLRNNSFGAAVTTPTVRQMRRLPFTLPGSGEPWPHAALRRPSLVRMPFVPGDPETRAANCREIFRIQATGLVKRLHHTGVQTVTIGLSGGLDSTLALLVTASAFDEAGLPRTNIQAITMPGFGTTSRTRGNAEALAHHLGASLRTIDITEAVRQHFRDIGHDEEDFGVTYENAQARERTQILMDVANKSGGFVIGTGDLSEAALGWMTFNGDHMSMYHVNAGVPKTLVRYLVGWAADELFADDAARVLHDIVDTPITPELLPLTATSELAQKTEETIGPYELHDFFLYHTLRAQAPPEKLFFLARHAFDGAYDAATLLRWMETFYRRFFSQQFKRSSMPDGPKVGTVALSPRGDWRMPSDASSALWLEAVARLRDELAAEHKAATGSTS